VAESDQKTFKLDMHSFPA